MPDIGSLYNKSVASCCAFLAACVYEMVLKIFFAQIDMAEMFQLCFYPHIKVKYEKVCVCLYIFCKH